MLFRSDMGSFRIRDRKQLANVIFPIFDKYPLLTTKYFNYAKFKKAHIILEDSTLTKSEKNARIEALLLTKPDQFYISPAFLTFAKEESKNNSLPLPSIGCNSGRQIQLRPLGMDATDAKKIISKSWLIGFVEAEGSFYLVKKDSNRIVHGFGITQKLDGIVLEGIRHILHISTKVVYKNKYNHYMIDTTNSRAIQNIIEYFSASRPNIMKGMKAVEFRIWSRSFNKHKGDYSELEKVQKILRKLRKIRADNTLWNS